MGKSKTRRYVRDEVVILCIELGQRVDENGWHWDVVISRAGRDGAFTKTWDNRSGRLSAPQATDLAGWAQQSVYNALEAWGGVQGSLDV